MEKATSQFKYEMEDKKYCIPVYPAMYTAHFPLQNDCFLSYLALHWTWRYALQDVTFTEGKKYTKVEERSFKKHIQRTERDRYDNKIDEWHVGTRKGYRENEEWGEMKQKKKQKSILTCISRCIIHNYQIWHILHNYSRYPYTCTFDNKLNTLLTLRLPFCKK